MYCQNTTFCNGSLMCKTINIREFIIFQCNLGPNGQVAPQVKVEACKCKDKTNMFQFKYLNFYNLFIYNDTICKYHLLLLDSVQASRGPSATSREDEEPTPGVGR